MIISMIAAMAKNRVIGKDNDMPWGMAMPADLQHFKKITMGKPIIMGRKTFESIGRPLPGRQNIVITTDINYQREGIDVVNTPEAALRASNSEEVMIIGGGNIYQQFIPRTDYLYLTQIELQIEDFDTQFPDYLQYDWTEIATEAHPADANNAYPYQFITLKRNR